MRALPEPQPTAVSGLAIAVLEQGNPAQSQRPAPGQGAASPGSPPSGPPGAATGPATPGANAPQTPQEIRDNIRNQIRSSLRNGRDPQIVIPSDFVRNAVPQGAVEISIAMFVTIGIVIVMLPFARAVARHVEHKSTALYGGTHHLSPQIEQLQQSVDAMAVELERITEAQRFQSKLLAGKDEEPAKL